MEIKEEAIGEIEASCALVLKGTLRQFAVLRETAVETGMHIVYQRSTAPWIHLNIVTDEQIQAWRNGP